MALDSLTAKANTGSGTDVLAGRSTVNGFVGAAMLTNSAGAEITPQNPLPVGFNQLIEYPGFLLTSTSGTTRSGAYSVCITNVGQAAGTLGGVSLGPGLSVNLTPRLGNTVASVAYDATGTTFYIVEMSDGSQIGGGD